MVLSSLLKPLVKPPLKPLFKSLDFYLFQARARDVRDPSLKYNLWIAGTASVVLAACAAVVFDEEKGFETKVNDPSLIGQVQRNVAASDRQKRSS